MQDLRRALDDIGSIRQHLAARVLFRGFGPSVLAATGLLALVTALAQSIWMENPTATPLLYCATWTATAVVSAALIGAEMVTRSRRHHSGLADAMVVNAVEQFLPAGAAGAALGVTLLNFAPETVWLLPGVWQILVSLGLFAAVRSLPRTVILAAAWYFASGIAVVALASQTQTLSPWAMGVPFAVGQLMLAAILHIAYGETDDEG